MLVRQRPWLQAERSSRLGWRRGPCYHALDPRDTMHRTLAIVIVLALGLWLAAPSLASAQEATPAPTSPGIESSSSSGSLRDLNAASIAAGVGAILLALLGGGGITSVVLARRQVTREGKQEKRDSTKDIWASYERQIRLAEERGDKDAADTVRLEHEQQQVAWRAQQGIEQITPIEISTVKDEPALAPEELADLRGLLSESKDLAPALLSAHAELLRGNAYYKAEQYEQALAAYDRALELRPDHATTLMNRGVTLDELERYDDALVDLNRALEFGSNDGDAFNNRGVTLDHLKRPADALADYDRALGLRPNHAGTLMNRGVALASLKRYDEAFADLDRALDLRPSYADAFINRGNTFSLLERYAEAIADYSRAVELQPEGAGALMNRGTALQGLERHADAVADFDRSLQLRPDNATTLMNRAISLHHLGRPAEALHDYSRTIERDPRNVVALLNRASLQADMDDTAAAAEDLRRALNQADLGGFRREHAGRAATHPYFDPLRADPLLRRLFEKIVGAQPASK